MNNKLFSFALIAGLAIANVNVLQAQVAGSTNNSQEVTVETKKGEKLTGRWHGKYFRTHDGNEFHEYHHSAIKEEQKNGMEKYKKKSVKETAKETAKAKADAKKAAAA